MQLCRLAHNQITGCDCPLFRGGRRTTASPSRAYRVSGDNGKTGRRPCARHAHSDQTRYSPFITSKRRQPNGGPRTFELPIRGSNAPKSGGSKKEGVCHHLKKRGFWPRLPRLCPLQGAGLSLPLLLQLHMMSGTLLGVGGGGHLTGFGGVKGERGFQVASVQSGVWPRQQKIWKGSHHPHRWGTTVWV